MKSVPYIALLFLACVTMGLLGGCATVPVPVAMKRQLPRVPAECDPRRDAQFPRVRVVGGKPLGPEETAKWGVQARQWGSTIQARRRACGVYTRRMHDWK